MILTIILILTTLARPLWHPKWPWATK